MMIQTDPRWYRQSLLNFFFLERVLSQEEEKLRRGVSLEEGEEGEEWEEGPPACGMGFSDQGSILVLSTRL